MNQIILAWMRQSDPPILPIIAGSSTAQLAQNIGALKIKLSDEQMQRLNRGGDPDAAQGWFEPS